MKRNGSLDIKNLFSIVDITEEVQNRQYQIPFNIEQMDLMLKDNIPNIDIGTHCSNPYLCDFEEHCWKHIPSPSVFNLYWMNSSKKFEMYYKGLITYEDIPSDFALNTTQNFVETSKSNEPYMSNTKRFYRNCFHFLLIFDSHNIKNAIPRFDKQRPYMQIPFQYSLHILHEDGNIGTKEFLGDENSDQEML